MPVVVVYNLRAWEARTEGLIGVYSRPGLHIESRVYLAYRIRPWLENGLGRWLSA